PDIPDLKPNPATHAAILRVPSAPKAASALADELQAQLDKYKLKYSSVFQIENGIKLTSHQSVLYGGARVLTVILPREINVLGGSKSSIIRARIVIFAIGFGSEKVLASSSDIGKTFWGYASLEKELDALRPERATAVVQGAGDGGLQECLRIAFKPEYHDLAKAISLLEREVSDVSPEWYQLMLKILCAEDNAARAYMWGYDIPTVYKGLDEVHDSVIVRLLEPETKGAVLEWYRQVVREREIHIFVVDKHAHSGRVYALNRFLVKLLLTLTKRNLVTRVSVELTGGAPTGPADIGPIDRSGIDQDDGPQGTASKEDLLRHAVFGAIPNQYGVVR
ncbi:hypothetical protein AB0F57_39340, partial [Streptomyces tanashiensis]|uniref:hypothetical protein n=1 Tax=Streptomyces tanashiensis TaxID=67367 RepID=UPI0033CBD8D8